MDNKLRRCTVKTKDVEIEGLFHCWEQVSQIISPSLMRGGHGGGVVAQVYGLVEDAATGKVWRCEPYSIKFERSEEK